MRISLSAGVQRAAGSLTASSSLFIARREGVVDVSGSLREGGVGFAENDDKMYDKVVLSLRDVFRRILVDEAANDSFFFVGNCV